jgi:hypothetical protein
VAQRAGLRESGEQTAALAPRAGRPSAVGRDERRGGCVTTRGVHGTHRTAGGRDRAVQRPGATCTRWKKSR